MHPFLGDFEVFLNCPGEQPVQIVAPPTEPLPVVFAASHGLHAVWLGSSANVSGGQILQLAEAETLANFPGAQRTQTTEPGVFAYEPGRQAEGWWVPPWHMNPSAHGSAALPTT